MTYYFAYGSNMDESQMLKRCPSAKLIGKAFLEGYRLAFTHFSTYWKGFVADILNFENDRVWGILYEISKEDLFNLDINEGVPKNIYRRITEKVHLYKSPTVPIGDLIKLVKKGDYLTYCANHFIDLNNYKPIQAFVYEVVIKEEMSTTISLKYIDKIINAAEENHFPKDYISFLYTFSTYGYREKQIGILNLIDLLLQVVKKDDFNKIIHNQKSWGGAGLIITDSIKRKEKIERDYPSDIVVYSKYCKEISWVIFTIFKDKNLKWNINPLNKDLILKELGKTANEYQAALKNEDLSHIGICESIIQKTYELFG